MKTITTATWARADELDEVQSEIDTVMDELDVLRQRRADLLIEARTEGVSFHSLAKIMGIPTGNIFAMVQRAAADPALTATDAEEG